MKKQKKMQGLRNQSLKDYNSFNQARSEVDLGLMRRGEKDQRIKIIKIIEKGGKMK